MAGLADAGDVDIEVVDLSYSYRTGRGLVKAIEGVTFEVRRKEILSIVGPTGCGKSTLLRLLLGIEAEEYSGTVRIEPTRRAGGVGYVPQEPTLMPWRTAFQNAAVTLEIAGRRDGKPERDRVLELFGRFGLMAKRGALTQELSGGMKQRVAVIRSLVAHPQILLMDEPFSAVDFVTRLEADTLLRHFCRDLGATVLLVTHNIEEAIFLSDRVVVMRGAPGRIVEVVPTVLPATHDDAVNYRTAPGFGNLFRRIWSALEG